MYKQGKLFTSLKISHFDINGIYKFKLIELFETASESYTLSPVDITFNYIQSKY